MTATTNTDTDRELSGSGSGPYSDPDAMRFADQQGDNFGDGLMAYAEFFARLRDDDTIRLQDVKRAAELFQEILTAAAERFEQLADHQHKSHVERLLQRLKNDQ